MNTNEILNTIEIKKQKAKNAEKLSEKYNIEILQLKEYLKGKERADMRLVAEEKISELRRAYQERYSELQNEFEKSHLYLEDAERILNCLGDCLAEEFKN